MNSTNKKGRPVVTGATPKITDSRNFTLIASRLKTILFPLTLHSAEIIGMLALILWGALK